jgi:hypothetical protein
VCARHSGPFLWVELCHDASHDSNIATHGTTKDLPKYSHDERPGESVSDIRNAYQVSEGVVTLCIRMGIFTAAQQSNH